MLGKVLDEVEARLARRRLRMLGRELVSTAQPPAGLERIEHVVVLMMENHSYDNYLGMLQGRGDGFVLGADGAPVDPHGNRDAAGNLVPLERAASPNQFAGLPSQTWAHSHEQWATGACDGFARSAESATRARTSAGMRYWTAADLPFYYSLARTFPLATRWFCSCLGPTFPNRRFLVSATANGLMDDVSGALVDEPAGGTIFDYLNAAGISWANYHNKPRWKLTVKALVGRKGTSALRRAGMVASGVVPRLAKYMESELQFSAALYPMDPVQKLRHAPSLETFFAQAEAGTLPAVCIVDPDYGTFSEEDPQDIQVGESFAADVISAVMTSPCWPSTVLFWLYDEHGGYYDHVPPPEAVAPDDIVASSLPERHPWLRRLPGLRTKIEEIDAQDAGPRTYDRYGFRVPAVVVSPFARAECTVDSIYDHTSILKLIEQRWRLPALTRRDAAARSPLEALDLAGDPTFLTPPKLASPAKPGAWRRFEQSAPR